MTDPEREHLEQRVLVVAPTGKDAALACSLLGKNGFVCMACGSVAQLAVELEAGAGAVLIAEEALSAGGGTELVEMLRRQAPWSDLPLLLLTGGRVDDANAVEALESLGNVTLLERPIRVVTLLSAVRTALRARKRQYQARAHLQEREEADQRKDEFLATLAHELRNPLAPIRNAVQILRRSSGSPTAAGNLTEMMERQVSHLVRLVDDLLEVSRITRGKIELRRRPVTLAAVIEASVEISRPLIEASQRELNVHLPSEPVYLEADATRLAQVFANLLNNAAKYTPSGGRISVDARCEAEGVTVSVRDSGMGIAATALPRVFDMFVQADHAADRAQGGLGIGLTLVRRLVDMHGGTVEARSEGSGTGSEFIVRLPLAAALDNETANAPVNKQESVEAPTRVLVVDDNRDAAESLGLLLEMLGADVTVVYDGTAALEAVSALRPRTVFLDLGMPGMDGYEVARRIRRRKDAEDPILIALTGWGQERDRRDSRSAGFDHHLIKPADLDALQTLLEAAAARSTSAAK